MSEGITQMVAEGHVDSQFALVREHWTAARHLWLDHAEPLRSAGLGGDLPPDFWFGVGLPGIGSVAALGDRFEFTDNGKTAIIIPVYDAIPGMIDANPERHVDALVDLVAVDIDRPDRFWRRRGDALVLGNAYLEIAGQDCAPVPVFRNPLTWLGSGGAGVCILDWDYVRDLLTDHELVAEDLELGDQLEDALAPDIWIRGAAA